MELEIRFFHQWIRVLSRVSKSKAVTLHTIEAHGGREGIAPPLT
jgi:hypothetical protein